MVLPSTNNPVSNLALPSDDAPHSLTSPEVLFRGGHSYGGGLEITLITD